MPGDVLLIGIAQLAIVMAGFTGISATLMPAGSSWTASQRIRFGIIVSVSFNVMFESLLPVVAFPALNDQRTAIVLASALVALYLVVIVAIRAREAAGAQAIRARSTLFILAAAIASIVLFALNAVLFGSLTVYALALCVQLAVAVISFYSLITTASH